MTEEHRNQSTEHLVREVARRIVPMPLEATGDVDCIAQAKKLRNLAPDASMTDVGRTCEAAAKAARAAAYTAAAYYADRAAVAAYTADDAAHSAYYAANSNHAARVAAFAAAAGDVEKQEFDAILGEASAKAEAS